MMEDKFAMKFKTPDDFSIQESSSPQLKPPRCEQLTQPIETTTIPQEKQQELSIDNSCVHDEKDNHPTPLSLLSHEQPPTITTEVLPTLNDVMACQFSVWYPIFSNLPIPYLKRTNVTIKSQIIKPLPTEFIQYLLSSNSNDQRFLLPKNTRTSSALLEANHRHHSDDDDDDDDVWSSSSCDKDGTDEDDAKIDSAPSMPKEIKPQSSQHTYSFPELNEQIRTAIHSFREPVCIPKLNWSSPKDAIWINGNQNTMECRTAGDVYLLLKASDFITFDLLYACTDVVVQQQRQNSLPLTTVCKDDTIRHDNTMQSDIDHEMSRHNFSFELVLRKFCNLYPSQEFRCFVSYNTILGISQRYQQYHFPFLPDHMKEYRSLIYDFYVHAIRPNIHRMSNTLQQYIFDVYIDQQQRIWIIDFNVWGTRTDAILFHWSELLTLVDQAKTREQPPHHGGDNNTATTTTHTESRDNKDREEAISCIDFRIVESTSTKNDSNDNHCNLPQPLPQPIHPNPLSNYKAPLDTLFFNNHYQHHGDADTSTTFQDFMKLCVRPSSINDHTNSDDSSLDTD